MALLKKKLAFAFAIALMFLACGDDSVSGVNESVEKISEADIEEATYDDLPACKSTNKDKSAYVVDEALTYVCDGKKWVSEEEVDSKSSSSLNSSSDKGSQEGKKVSSSSNKAVASSSSKIVSSSSSNKVVSSSSTKKTSSSSNIAVDSSLSKCAPEFANKYMTYNGMSYRCYNDFWRPEKNPPKDSTAQVICLKTTDPNAPLKCYLDTAIWSSSSYQTDKSDFVDQGVIKIKDGSITGVAQKGPYLQGSSYRIIPLDGKTLKPLGDTLTEQFNNSKGTYTFCDLNLPSQYAMIEASGYYRSELTGNKSNLQMTIGAIVDVQKGANINMITNLEYERVKNLVQKEGYNIAGAKKRALTEVLSAFHIENVTGSAEQLDITQDGETNGALLAISIMIQGVAGSEFNVIDMMKDFREDIKDDGKWTGAVARTKIADIAFAADSAGNFPVYRRNIEGWNLSKNVPFFESYINDFWGSEFGVGKCTEERFGEIKKNQNSASVHKNNYFLCDTVWYSTRFGYSGFLNSNRQQSDKSEKRFRWRYIDQFEYNTRNNVCDVKGLVIPGNIDKDKHYICEKACSSCSYNQWREATDMEVDRYYTECTQDGKLHKFSDGKYYKCSNDDFVVADKLDSILEKGCVSYNSGKIVVLKDVVHAYICDSGSWKKNGWAESNCSKDGLIYKMQFELGSRMNDFVCDADTFRVATTMDSSAIVYGAVCTSYMEGQDNRVKTHTCTNGKWIWNGNYETFKDSRDGKTYKAIQIGTQKWMAENLNFEYKIRDSIYNNFCGSDSCRTYGRYYTWATAMDSAGVYSTSGVGCGFRKNCTPTYPVRGVCPESWHLPTSDEWKTLFFTVGRNPFAMQAKGYDDWKNATDEYGFSALPALALPSDIFFESRITRFWSASQRDSVDGTNFILREIYGGVHPWLEWIPKNDGIPIRCVKD